MVLTVNPTTSNQDIADAGYVDSNIDNSHSLDLLIEIFKVMVEQSNLGRHQTRELNRQQFQCQKDAAAYPRNAAIATLTLTVISGAVSIIGSSIGNSTQLANRVGPAICATPGLGRLFDNPYNATTFQKAWEGGSAAVAKILSGGADAASSFGNSLSQMKQADGTRLQHLYSNASDDRRRASDEFQRLLRDMQQILEQRAAASRAVMGK